MALKVLKMEALDGKPSVTLTSDLPQFNLAISELQSAETRRLAIQHAGTQGVSTPRCEMPSAPYPVDAKGDQVVDAKTQKIAEYRIDVPISSGM
jgi:hypothetical protein